MKGLGGLCVAGLGLALLLSPNAALAQFGGPPQQQQGFETTGQNPANYTPEEAAAAQVVIDWINTTNAKDLAGHMALIDNDIAYRADPAEALGREGPRGYCAFYIFIHITSWLRLDELYVIGGPDDALVLLKRADINAPVGQQGDLGGYAVALADLVRVKNGKIVEWYDIPINRVGGLLTDTANSRAQGTAVLPPCMAYPGNVSVPPPNPNFPGLPPGGLGTPEPHPSTPTTLNSGMVSYTTNKSEGFFNAEENEAAKVVRGWFAARKAADPQLLAGFVDKNAISRATPDVVGVVNGRDALLKSVCAVMSGSVELKDIYLIGADFETTVIARWNWTAADGKVSKMGSFFRVQNGLITEWMDSAVDGALPPVDPNSAACKSINETLAAFAPLPIVGGPTSSPPAPGAGAAPPPAGGPPPAAPPA